MALKILLAVVGVAIFYGVLFAANALLPKWVDVIVGISLGAYLFYRYAIWAIDYINRR